MTSKCKVCGNEYDKPLEIVRNGTINIYDCFECAIHDLAPACVRCDVRIVGHGVEANGSIFCGAHCAAEHGIEQLQDRV
jgi:hypothetical protein